MRRPPRCVTLGSMADGPRWHLVCYDVRDPKRLRKCARHLEGHGERVQYSVFRCRLTRAGARRLHWELTALLEPEDEVLMIPLCDRCVEGVRVNHSSANAGAEAERWRSEPETHEIL